ncbi:MAG TPA: methyltransferase [Cyclobacteriaceae bacterium]|nr:methyltransferase [Cyclobacteriaceae bacterium]
MANTFFRFKKFIIHQDRCGMKLSTDAVLLGALASYTTPQKILDIGTGTGAIALMLAQRYPYATIEAVEIDKEAFDQASENAALSPWNDYINIFHRSFQEHAQESIGAFNLIVSNPPYFPDHIKSQDQQRNLALHNDALPFTELIDGVSKLLAPSGQFWVILPERQMVDLEYLAVSKNLFPQEKVAIHNHPSGRVLRVIQAFGYHQAIFKERRLYIRDEKRNYSYEYKALLKDFLLDF